VLEAFLAQALQATVVEMTATRVLYLARHGQAVPDQSELTAKGRRQAELLGKRLREVPFAAFHHSPLPRAVQTSHLIADQLVGEVPLVVSEAVGDYIPYVPERAELPEDSADLLLDFVGQFNPAELAEGPPLAAEAIDTFTGPVDGAKERHELIVTHNFQVGWLVSHALDAPKWRWLSLNHCNAALTVLRYTPGRPSSVLVYNDMSHLPTELRWTGFPAEQHV
jgi:probable phosphoglycerate mutase